MSKSLSIKSLLESSLTNIDNVNQDVAKNQKMVQDLTKPMDDFLSQQEKSAQERIKDDNKIKSIIQSPEQKKVKDKQIQSSQQQILKIKQLQSDLQQKAQELEKQQQEYQKKIQAQIDNITQQSQTQKQNQNLVNQSIQEDEVVYDKNASLPIITRGFSKREKMNETNALTNPSQMPAQTPAPQPAPAVPQKKHPVIKVKFDSNTQMPWEATFTERGFKVSDTRFSFEDIDTALSKNYVIVLDGGQGLTLDAIKMQKLLKYRDRF